MDLRPAEVLRRVVVILDSLEIPYMLGGSYASSVHGVARFTRDADLVVDLALDQIGPLAAQLGPELYVAPEAMREAVRRRVAFNAIHPESGFKVDFFVLSERPFDRESFGRRRQVRMDDPATAVWIYSPEDIVLRKLEWFQSGGGLSDQQWRDVIGILTVQRGKLDGAYLARWATRLGVRELLDRAMNEASAG